MAADEVHAKEGQYRGNLRRKADGSRNDCTALSVPDRAEKQSPTYRVNC
jgi:hypothetical protein